MTELSEKAPDFGLQAVNGEAFQLSEHAGERPLLVFYPGDDTPASDVSTAMVCRYVEARALCRRRAEELREAISAPDAEGKP